MSTAINHTNYRVEIWTGKEYQRTYVYSDGSRAEHNDAIRALWNDPDHNDGDKLAYRIVRVDKKRPMKPRARWSTQQRRSMDDGLSLTQMAEAGATHYFKLRTRDLTTHLDPDIKTQVPVYPVKPSGRGTASEFRLRLASLLTGATRTGEYWGWTMDKTRIHRESQLADHGFEFVEIDMEDYS